MKYHHLLNADTVDSPALLIFPEIANTNIKKAISYVSDVDVLRPHVKTHKMVDVAKKQLALGINKFKCATIAEAEMLAISGAKDVLLAYQPNKAKALRLLELSKKYPEVKFACLIDNIATATMINELFNTKILNVYIDLNIGMNRSGIKPENTLDLIKNCSNLKNINIFGLHGYDGHIEDIDPTLRKTRVEEVYGDVAQLKKSIAEELDKTVEIVLGGTPTFHLYNQLDKTIQVSPGTFIFWDYDYNQLLPDLEFGFAAILLTRVVSIIDEQTVCLDLGHKSVSSEHAFPRVKFLDDRKIHQKSHSEEHMVIKVENSAEFKVGDVLYAIPNHVCPTVALFSTVNVVENNKVTDYWKVIARDRAIHI